METTKKKYRYIEWLTPDELHADTLQWMSELRFIRDEQFFLNDLVKSNTLELMDSKNFEESKKLIDDILKAEKEIVLLMKKVQAHENELEIMVNDVDELKMEKAYIETHWEILAHMEKYQEEYRKIKKRLFKVVSQLMKKQKQKRLLN
jgi:hypothetical protein